MLSVVVSNRLDGDAVVLVSIGAGVTVRGASKLGKYVTVVDKPSTCCCDSVAIGPIDAKASGADIGISVVVPTASPVTVGVTTMRELLLKVASEKYISVVGMPSVCCCDLVTMITVDVKASDAEIGISVVVLTTSPVLVGVTETDELLIKCVSEALSIAVVTLENMGFSVVVLTASPAIVSVTEMGELLIKDVSKASLTVVVSTKDATMPETNRRLVFSGVAVSELGTASSRDVVELGKSTDEVSGARASGSLRVEKLFSLDGSVSDEVLVWFMFGIPVADTGLSVVIANTLLVVFGVVIVEELTSELEDDAVHFPLISMSASFGTVACCAGKAKVHSFNSLMLLTPRSDNRR